MSKRGRSKSVIQDEPELSSAEHNDGEFEQGVNADEGENYGFQPDEAASGLNDDQNKKAERIETPEEKRERDELIREITRLISRYPGIKPRTNCALIESLQSLELTELKNVYFNAMNDIQEKRGTPAAEFMIMMTCWFPEKLFIPGVTERCLDDIELVRDVDQLMTEKMGALGTVSNIIFRVAKVVTELRTGIAYKKRKLSPQEELFINSDNAPQSNQVHEQHGTSNSENTPPYSTYIHGEVHAG
jgi:hypothetical protein